MAVPMSADPESEVEVLRARIAALEDALLRMNNRNTGARQALDSAEDAQGEGLIEAIVESSDDAIISKDLDGTIMSWNKGAERLFGYTADEAIGKNIAMLAVPERIDEMPNILRRLRNGERIEHYETVRQGKDGRRIDISLTVSPIFGPDRSIVGASKIARDISDRKLAEAASAHRAEQLNRANADLLQFSYITSHDLKEPLRTIRAFTEMFLLEHRNPLTEEESAWLSQVVQAAGRMNAMITDLLSYSQHTSNEAIFEDVETREAVEWAIDNLSLAAASAGAKIECDFASLPRVRGNKIALAQVFQNLLSNAIEYHGPAPPVIQITARRKERIWVFAVKDNGTGIDPRYFEQIFVLFKRLHRSSEHAGTGIGLALCKRIVENHGGRIWVESEIGKGSTFFFTLSDRQAV
jgi:PAS domain S-box-containing protein